MMKANNETQKIQKRQDTNTYNQNAKNDTQKLIIDFTPENIVQGFIFSEIIGKPKSRRMGRWY